jgi:aerobic carbon-monoxide dehydrogenase small subunit
MAISEILKRIEPAIKMAKKVVVEATINGEQTEFLCEPRQSLLEVLRDVLELTGSKEGCLTGDCGACTVIVNGRPLCSCLMLGVEAQGTTIQTVEGLAKPDSLHVLQQKFLEHASLQCGICTPGFLMSAKALLDRTSKPTEAEIRYALAGNLCRCTGYDKIVRAVTDAAQTLAAGTRREGRLGSGPSASEQTEQFLQEQEVK